MGDPGSGGFGGAAGMRGTADLASVWWGFFITLMLGLVLALVMPTPRVREGLRRLGSRLEALPILPFSWAMGALSAGLALLVSVLLFQKYPTLLDGMVNLLQSRLFATGQAAAVLPEPAAAWLIQNTVLTPEGWVSQYPPFPALLLALGQWARAPWLIPPLQVGTTVFLAVLLFQRVLPDDPVAVRFGGILLALSPFLLFLGGGYLSHVPAALFGTLSLYAAVRASRGGWAWGILVGVGSGAAVASRPLFGAVVAVGIPSVLWLLSWEDRGIGWVGRRLGAALAGGAPMAVALGLYNRHFFGHPLKLGYSAAFGPSHGLGFHRDPWGNVYGVAEAVGSTAGDLLSLGVFLLETPLSPVLLVGAFLFLRPPPRRAGLLLAWAFLPLVANAFFWHHGFHFGPRMLYETIPPWIILTALAALTLAGRESQAPPNRVRPNPRDVVLWTLLISALGAAVLAPLRAGSYRWNEETLARLTVPETTGSEAALVFVHGSWSERVASRLQASGMRLDSVEVALRRNDLCRVHNLALTLGGLASGKPVTVADLDFRPLPGIPAHLSEMALSEGYRILADPLLEPSESCILEARADRTGIVSLAPLIWQGDLPGLERGDPLFVRDLGWRENEAVREIFPERTAYLLVIPAPGESPTLQAYELGMGMLWGEVPD
jgi:hypothetical protein